MEDLLLSKRRKSKGEPSILLVQRIRGERSDKNEVECVFQTRKGEYKLNHVLTALFILSVSVDEYRSKQSQQINVEYIQKQ